MRRYLREATLAQLRNPLRRFADRVRELIFQDCYFYRPFSLRDLAQVDPQMACAHFNRCFCNPAEFTLCFTGSLKVLRCSPSPTADAISSPSSSA